MIPTGEATALGLTSRPGTWRMEQGRENTPKPRIREGFPNCTDFRPLLYQQVVVGKKLTEEKTKPLLLINCPQ